MLAPQLLAFGWRRFGLDGGQGSQELPGGDHSGEKTTDLPDTGLFT